MKTGDKLSASIVRALVAIYGVESFRQDGKEVGEECVIDSIEDSDEFTVQLNYANGVQLHMEDEQGSTIIILADLKGRCDDIKGWVA